MNADGSGVTEVTSGPNFDSRPTWSADGRIVFERDFRPEGTGGAIEIVNRDGSGLTTLVSTPTCCFFDPAMSPDGTTISFWNLQLLALQVLDLGSGMVTTLASGSSLGGGEDFRLSSWSPDGLWLAVGAEEFAFGGEGLYLVSADGETILPVPNGDWGADPVWMPTGTG